MKSVEKSKIGSKPHPVEEEEEVEEETPRNGDDENYAGATTPASAS